MGDEIDRAGLHGRDEPLRAENDALRAEVATLRRRVEDLEERTRESAAIYQAILENAPLTIGAKDEEGRYILANARALAITGRSWDEVRGKSDYDLFPQEVADSFVLSDREVMATRVNQEREDSVPMEDGEHHFVTIKFPLLSPGSEILGSCSISTDITTFRRAEAENRRLQEEIIRAQDVTLRALSSPLLPIAKGVVVMPLIGHIDRRRAQHILEKLLDGIVDHSASSVILDVTGVPIVDTEIATSLVKTARAARLLGASVILTGIQPSIAQTLVGLGADLTGVETEGTLESGITLALRRCSR